jgi:hypothetical protein
MARRAEAGWFWWNAAIFRRCASEFDAEIADLVDYLRFILKIDDLRKWLAIRWLQRF